MAGPGRIESLPSCLTTSASDPCCERINKVAWRSIWPFACAIGFGLGSLAAWAFSLNPLLTLVVCVGLALFVATTYYAFQTSLPYAIAVEWNELQDVVTSEPLKRPLIALDCGHTAEAASALRYITERNKCTAGGCTQFLFTKDRCVDNRLIGGLLYELHGKSVAECEAAFCAFVKKHKDQSMVLPNGHSCDVLGQLLLMRARCFDGDWNGFVLAYQGDLYRNMQTAQPRIGVDLDALQAALGKNAGYNRDWHDQLEELYKASTYNRRWERIVDKYESLNA